MRLTIGSSQDGMWRIIHLAGELDLTTVPALRQVLQAELAAGGLHLAIEASDLDFADSTGLGALIGGLRRARAQGGDLRIVGPSSGLSRLLDLTGLEAVFAPVPTVDDLPQGESGAPDPASQGDL